MTNKVFDSDINQKIHKATIEISQTNTKIASAAIKALSTIVELLSNLSPTNLPKIASDIAGLANPLVDATKNMIEVHIKQIENLKDLQSIQKSIQLPDLTKINPIQEIPKPNIINPTKDISKPNIINTSISG